MNCVEGAGTSRVEGAGTFRVEQDTQDECRACGQSVARGKCTCD